jgi:hypothetical protein
MKVLDELNSVELWPGLKIDFTERTPLPRPIRVNQNSPEWGIDVSNTAAAIIAIEFFISRLMFMKLNVLAMWRLSSTLPILLRLTLRMTRKARVDEVRKNAPQDEGRSSRRYLGIAV